MYFTNQMLIFRTKTITTELSIPQEMMLESALSEIFFHYRSYYVELFVEGMPSPRTISDKHQHTECSP